MKTALRAALALLVLGGCGQTSFSDPVGITLRVSAIDFGPVATGTIASQSLEITNASTGDVTVIIGPPQGPAAAYFHTDPPAYTSLLIAQGGTKPLKVSYAPVLATPDPAHCYFSLRWCDISNDCLTLVTLQGRK